jgi:hypothetical protein
LTYRGFNGGGAMKRSEAGQGTYEYGLLMIIALIAFIFSFLGPSTKNYGCEHYGEIVNAFSDACASYPF